jgi:hypothetical protein
LSIFRVFLLPAILTFTTLLPLQSGSAADLKDSVFVASVKVLSGYDRTIDLSLFCGMVADTTNFPGYQELAQKWDEQFANVAQNARATIAIKLLNAGEISRKEDASLHFRQLKNVAFASFKSKYQKDRNGMMTQCENLLSYNPNDLPPRLYDGFISDYAAVLKFLKEEGVL